MALPRLTERERFDKLNALKIGEEIIVPVDEQYHYSRVASMFKRITDKVFVTTRKGQKKGFAIVKRMA